MGVVALAKRIITRTDDPAELAAEIETLKKSAIDAIAEIERLEAERLQAGDYEAAKAVDDPIRRAQWTVDAANTTLPQLEARLKAAQAEQHRRAISRHLQAVRQLYPRMKAAILAAAELQAEAIKLREAAIAEIGEAAATVNLPIVAFRGLVLPDLVRLWSDELDRIVLAPTPQRVVPAPATTSKTTASKSTKPTRLLPAPAPAPPRPKRQPRQAAEPAEGEITLMFLRPGIELDGTQSVTGDVVNVREAIARELLRSGAAETVKGRSSNG